MYLFSGKTNLSLFISKTEENNVNSLKVFLIILVILLSFNPSIKADTLPWDLLRAVTFCKVWSPQMQLLAVTTPNACAWPVPPSPIPGFLHTYFLPDVFVSVFDDEKFSHFAPWPVSLSVILKSPLISNLVMRRNCVTGLGACSDLEYLTGGFSSARDSSGSGDFKLNAHVGPVFGTKQFATLNPTVLATLSQLGSLDPIPTPRPDENCIYYSTRQDAYQWRTGRLDLLNPGWQALNAWTLAATLNSGNELSKKVENYTCKKQIKEVEEKLIEYYSDVNTGESCKIQSVVTGSEVTQDGYECMSDFVTIKASKHILQNYLRHGKGFTIFYEYDFQLQKFETTELIESPRNISSEDNLQVSKCLITPLSMGSEQGDPYLFSSINQNIAWNKITEDKVRNWIDAEGNSCHFTDFKKRKTKKNFNLWLCNKNAESFDDCAKHEDHLPFKGDEYLLRSPTGKVSCVPKIVIKETLKDMYACSKVENFNIEREEKYISKKDDGNNCKANYVENLSSSNVKNFKGMSNAAVEIVKKTATFINPLTMCVIAQQPTPPMLPNKLPISIDAYKDFPMWGATAKINFGAVTYGPKCNPPVSTLPFMDLDANCYGGHFLWPRQWKSKASDVNTAAFVTALKALQLSRALAGTAPFGYGDWVCGEYGAPCFPYGTPPSVVSKGIRSFTPTKKRWGFVIWKPHTSCHVLPIEWNLAYGTQCGLPGFSVGLETGFLTKDFAEQAKHAVIP